MEIFVLYYIATRYAQMSKVGSKENPVVYDLTGTGGESAEDSESDDPTGTGDEEDCEPDATPCKVCGSVRCFVRCFVRSFLISDEDSDRVDAALEEGTPSEVLVSGFKVDLTRENLSCCAPNTWLKDEVVNFYFQLLNERNKRLRTENHGCVPDAHFDNSFFMSKLRDHERGYVYKNVRKWTIRKRKVDLFSKDLIVVPININDMHWTLCVVFVGMKVIQYYDSIESDDPMGSDGSAYTSTLLRYLEDEWKDKAERYPATRNGGAAFNTKEWTLASDGRTASGGGTVAGCAVPLQLDGSSCGVFMCQFASQIALGRENFDFDQNNMEYFRRQMVLSILNTKVTLRQ